MSVAPKIPDFKDLLSRLDVTIAVHIQDLGHLSEDPLTRLQPIEIDALEQILRNLQFLQQARGAISTIIENAKGV